MNNKEDEFNYMLETLGHNSILTQDCGVCYYWECSTDYNIGKKQILYRLIMSLCMNF